ncbi:type VI secretion system amidase effector protein Tae4 [Caballeronia sp. LjRoot34]|uniref:hypothetical protein n=1 Tax=Caballeronia sp. LjRoot34 TaxID=3342325 RepID=UPI003ED0A85E
MSDGSFDINAAVAHLNNHSSSHPNHYCARAIRHALAAGGVALSRYPADAKDYGQTLLSNGFVRVTSNDMYLPRKGDIAVIQPYSGGSSAGHITMYNGNQWVSDFKQADMWSGPGYRKHKPAFQVFRSQSEQ